MRSRASVEYDEACSNPLGNISDPRRYRGTGRSCFIPDRLAPSDRDGNRDSLPTAPYATPSTVTLRRCAGMWLSGRAPALGAGRRRFESCYPDTAPWIFDCARRTL
jgi:hypothetical protein